MTLIRITGGNSVPAVGQHAHYNSESVKAGVVDAWPLRSDANINAADFTGTNAYTYDATEDGAKSDGFTGSYFKHTTDNDFLNLRFSRSVGNDGVTYTDGWLSYQLEFMMNSAWNANTENRTTVKAWRLYDVGKTGGGTDDRVIECQIRFSVTQSDVVGLPTVRSYQCTTPAYSAEDPLRGTGSPTFDWQPSLEAASLSAERSSGHALADHNAGTEKPFLVVAGKWIRYTFNWDLTNDELTVTMSDEDTDPVIVCADPSTADTGFSVNRNGASHNPVANELKIDFSTSDESLTVTGTEYMWFRNVIISSQEISHGTRPNIQPSRSHFDTYKDTVAQSLDFTSDAQILSLSPGGTNDVWTYDAATYAAKCLFDSTGPNTGIKPGVGNVISWAWGQDYGYDGASNLDTDLWFQWEFMYSGAFNDVATYAAALDRHKTHYLYNSGSTDFTWRHEYKTTASDCVGHATIVPQGGTAMREDTTYSPHWNNHPFGDGEGVRYNVTHAAVDHLNDAGVTNPGGFLTLPNVWCRITTHFNAQNKTCRAWLADENNDPVQIISANGDLNSGFDFSADHTNDFLYDEMRLTWDTSQTGTVFVSPDVGYVYTRFYLMDTSAIPLGGRPIA